MFFSTRRNIYDTGEGPIRHLDGSCLGRPLALPREKYFIGAILTAIAAIIGVVILFNVFSSLGHAVDLSDSSVEENLSRPDSTKSLPQLSSLVDMSGEDIKSSFEGAGFTIFDRSALSESSDGSIDYIKLPDDVTLTDAAVLYQKDLTKLSASQASLLLNGSWEFTQSGGNTNDMHVRYADFLSGGLEAAIEAAASSQGFDASSATSSGTDDAGNSFQEGTINANGKSLTWRISAIKLSSKYSIAGLPDNAVYVGIHLS